ncbi:hypothetical protein L8C07_13240 [Paenibacillus sp. CMAA1739]|uniref:hypothetical protein n=1 Tax=Paenibacillus ottowii TaxID=2315729 RepID=UPI002DBDA197|nr:hypothetical protein [Paenibacillus sp. CMAA1739]MEC4566909.1 hypothetical protein [Paenibacillus sp. CMAA1739]
MMVIKQTIALLDVGRLSNEILDSHDLLGFLSLLEEKTENVRILCIFQLYSRDKNEKGK